MITKLRALAVFGIWTLLFSLCPTVSQADVPSICDGMAGNLINNCGFETGSLSDWTVTPASSGSNLIVTNTPSGVNSGQDAAGFGATAHQNDFIEQSFATIPGDIYEVRFYVDASQGVNGIFFLNWNGRRIFTQNGGLPGGYMGYYGFQEPTSATSMIEFGGNTTSGFYYLDDVSVVRIGTPVVPEPGTLVLFGIGVIGLWKVRRSKE